MERGGVGLKMAKVMNKVLLAKLAWRMLIQGDDIWCKVMKAKYGMGQSSSSIDNKLLSYGRG